MFGKELMVCGLVRQNALLEHLIEDLERKERMKGDDFVFSHHRLKEVGQNLRQLRKLKRNYEQYRSEIICN